MSQCHNISKTSLVLKIWYQGEQELIILFPNLSLFASWCNLLVKMSLEQRVYYSLSHISDVIITEFECQRSSTNPCSTSSADPESVDCPQNNPHRSPVPLPQLVCAWVGLRLFLSILFCQVSQVSTMHGVWLSGCLSDIMLCLCVFLPLNMIVFVCFTVCFHAGVCGFVCPH